MNANLLLCTLLIASAAPSLLAQQLSPEQVCASEIVATALTDARALHPGMTRRDVEKAFVNASFVGPSPTQYTYRKCPPIHIEVKYHLKVEARGNTAASFSPDDIIISVSRPYLDDVTSD